MNHEASGMNNSRFTKTMGNGNDKGHRNEKTLDLKGKLSLESVIRQRLCIDDSRYLNR